MRRAVLDANVYVSAAIRPEGPPGLVIRRLLEAPAFEIVLPPAIAAEVLRALAYPKVQKLIRGDLDAALWFEDIWFWPTSWLTSRQSPGSVPIRTTTRTSPPRSKAAPASS